LPYQLGDGTLSERWSRVIGQVEAIKPQVLAGETEQMGQRLTAALLANVLLAKVD